MNLLEAKVSVPLGLEAHNRAKEFASVQNNPQLGKKVYLNTLAVWSVHTYLKWMQIETHLSESNSSKLALSTLGNARDLMIPNLGKIECCPVFPNEHQIPISVEIFEQCIGLVGVQFNQDFKEVQLLGFIPILDIESDREELSIEELKPMEDIFDYLWRLRTGIETLPVELRKNSDPVAAKLLQRIESQGLPKIIAQLEKLIRSLPEFEWRFEASNILQGSQETELLGALKGGENQDEEDEEEAIAEAAIADFAEELTEILNELWHE